MTTTTSRGQSKNSTVTVQKVEEEQVWVQNPALLMQKEVLPKKQPDWSTTCLFSGVRDTIPSVPNLGPLE